MVQHLIVHAGFHKTGTTTIQNTLAAHSATLTPHARVLLRPDMDGLCEAARTYSRSLSAFDLGLVGYEAAVLAEGWSAATILVSSEDLSGHMPGRHGLTGYSAAPALVAAMTEAWRSVLPDMRITWAFSTRAAAPWLASCHVQHVRAARMTLDAAEYAAQFAGSADLDGIVADVRATVQGADVHAWTLEDHSASPVAPLLALADVPKDVSARIIRLAPANTSPSREKIDAMLALNRSDLPHPEWRAAQNALHRNGR